MECRNLNDPQRLAALKPEHIQQWICRQFKPKGKKCKVSNHVGTAQYFHTRRHCLHFLISTLTE